MSVLLGLRFFLRRDFMESMSINNLINQAMAMTENLAELSHRSSPGEFHRRLVHLQTKLEETRAKVQLLQNENKKLKKELNLAESIDNIQTKNTPVIDKNTTSSEKFSEFEVIKKLINHFDYKESQIKNLFADSSTIQELAHNFEKLDNFLFNSKRMLKYWKENPKIVRELHQAKKILNQGEFRIP
jgi:hypothetical protein